MCPQSLQKAYKHQKITLYVSPSTIPYLHTPTPITLTNLLIARHGIPTDLLLYTGLRLSLLSAVYLRFNWILRSQTFHLISTILIPRPMNLHFLGCQRTLTLHPAMILVFLPVTSIRPKPPRIPLRFLHSPSQKLCTIILPPYPSSRSLHQLVEKPPRPQAITWLRPFQAHL